MPPAVHSALRAMYCKVGCMRRIAPAIVVLALLMAPHFSTAQSARKTPAFQVRRPTVIAFFEPVTEADLEKDADLNEALSDFQLYAGKVGRPLQQLGVDFHQISARSFRIRVNGKTSMVRVKNTVGYYFVMPGKKPLVQCGVETDDDIVATARKYFGLPPAAH